MDIEIYSLRIFCQVIKDKTFSKAAKSLHLAQPTVSQQIAKLELALNVRLFERVGHDVILTQNGTGLYKFACQLLDLVNDYTETLQTDRSAPKGLVRYGLPESCQWTPHFKKMMNRISEFPEIDFEIEVLPNDQIVKRVLEASLDFGFIVGEKLTPDLRFEKFSEEKYVAVAAKEELITPLKTNNFDALKLISYPGYEPYLENWAKTHGLWKEINKGVIRPKIKVGTLSGAVLAVREGAGVGILPSQCVSDELSSKSLIEWSSKKDLVAQSPIYLAKRTGETHPKRVEMVLEILKNVKLPNTIKR